MATCYAQVRVKAMFEKEYKHLLYHWNVTDAVKVEVKGSSIFEIWANFI